MSKWLLRCLLDGILRNGRFASAIVGIFIVPREKPLKGPREVESDRPISLICGIAEMLEALDLNRITPALEPQISDALDAHFSGRGSEMHFQEMFDFLKADAGERRFIYLATS